MAYSIFIDTSAWYAYIDKSDTDHDSAANVVRNLNRPLITSNYISDETLTLTSAFDSHFSQYGQFVIIPSS